MENNITRADHILWNIIDKIITIGKIPEYICFYYTHDYIKYENEEMYFKSTRDDTQIVVNVPKQFIEKAKEIYKEHQKLLYDCTNYRKKTNNENKYSKRNKEIF